MITGASSARSPGELSQGRAGNGLSKPPSEYLRDLYYDTLINHQPALRLATEQFGADHLMLGSDYPLGSGWLEDALAFVQNAIMTEAERELVLGANAVRVFNCRWERRPLLHLRLHRHLPIRERWPDVARFLFFVSHFLRPAPKFRTRDNSPRLPREGDLESGCDVANVRERLAES